MKDNSIYKVSSFSIWAIIIGMGLLFVAAYIIYALLMPGGLRGLNVEGWITLVVASGLCYFGVQMALRFSGVVVNKTNRSVIQWNLFFIRFRKTEIPFDSVREVTLSKTLHHSNDGASVFYSVVIEGAESIKVTILSKYNLARHHAEKIASLIGVPLVDNTTGISTQRDPGMLDMPFFKKLQQAGISGQIPEPPAGSGITIEREPGEVRIIIPCNNWGWKSCASIFFGIPLLIAGIVSLLSFIKFIVTSHVQHDEGCLYGFIAFVGCALGYALVGIGSLRGMGRQIITINSAGLSLRKVSFIARETFHQPADELEELVIGMLANTTTRRAERGIIARSDKKSVMIGETLSEDERTWLREAMVKAIAGLEGM